ncbi:MAG: hypothetical protein WCT85_03340 [Parachlamydiales bacterium]|jgi:hypothetical protein
MKVNKEILSIPPYISTSWENILSLFTAHDHLIVVLKNGSKVEIPDLNVNLIEVIFDTHAKFLENQTKKTGLNLGLSSLTNSSMDSLSYALQHNPEQKNSPNMPPDIIKKIANLAKLFAEESNIDMPKPEPDCNCMHCQIAKALQIGAGVNPENLDEEVKEEDLKFRVWDIKEEGNKLYSVTNPLDTNEHYSVFLGTPIGCTCGKKNCEHIKAVLDS